MTDHLPMLPPGVSSVADLGTTLTLREVAERLGVSQKTARRMVTRGDLEGAHQVPMSTGRGTQWVVPVSSVEQVKTKQRSAPTPSADLQAQQVAELQAQVANLQQKNELLEALATERAQQLEQLHLTMRLALTAGEQPRRWWQKKKQAPNTN